MYKVFYFAILVVFCSACSNQTNYEEEFKLGQVAFGKGDYSVAYEIWKPLAEAGYSHAQDTLAYLNLQGLGIEQNNKEAIRLYTTAAENGHIEAMYNLGHIYHLGQIVEVDLKKSLYYFHKSYCAGFPLSIIGLTDLYKRGVLTFQSEEQRKFIEDQNRMLEDPEYIQRLKTQAVELSSDLPKMKLGCN